MRLHLSNNQYTSTVICRPLPRSKADSVDSQRIDQIDSLLFEHSGLVINTHYGDLLQPADGYNHELQRSRKYVRRSASFLEPKAIICGDISVAWSGAEETDALNTFSDLGNIIDNSLFYVKVFNRCDITIAKWPAVEEYIRVIHKVRWHRRSCSIQ